MKDRQSLRQRDSASESVWDIFCAFAQMGGALTGVYPAERVSF